MGIENTIKKMEETLEKKKAVLREKSVGKIAKLKERIKVKNDKLERITKERDALENEVADLTSDENVKGVEQKTETFIPGKEKESKDSSAKNPKKK